MRLDMKLYDGPFEDIKNGIKDVEFRLNDEKRQQIRIGDEIFFHRYDDEYDILICRVTGVYRYPSFRELFEYLGRDDHLSMYEIYSREQEQKYGVCGIRIELLDRDYLVDGHMHLEYGPLNKEYVLEFVREAERKGLDEIDILDHTHRFKEFRDCYRHLERYEVQKKWLSSSTKFCSTLDDYERLIDEIRKMDLGIKVKFGLEVCYTEDTEEMLRTILHQHSFDFLTGAVHSFNHILYDMSFSRELLWDKYDVNDIYRDYYRAVMKCVDSGLFDRLAHPDTIKLFNYYPSYDLTETYELLSDKLNERKMHAENNTGCHYRYHHQDVGLSDELLKVFKEKKVRLITASDAHHPEDVGSYIKQATTRNRGK